MTPEAKDLQPDWLRTVTPPSCALVTPHNLLLKTAPVRVRQLENRVVNATPGPVGARHGAGLMIPAARRWPRARPRRWPPLAHHAAVGSALQAGVPARWPHQRCHRDPLAHGGEATNAQSLCGAQRVGAAAARGFPAGRWGRSPPNPPSPTAVVAGPTPADQGPVGLPATSLPVADGDNQKLVLYYENYEKLTIPCHECRLSA